MRKQFRIQFLFLTIILVLVSLLSIIQTNGVSYEATFEELGYIASTGGDTFACEVIDDIAIIIDMHGGLVTYNVSDPANPVHLDTYFDGGIPHSFYLVDDLLYLADHHQGLEIYNVSNPRNIIKLSQIVDSGDGETDGVFVSNNIAYTAEWHDSTWDWKMVLINVTDPTSPVRITEYTDDDNEFIRFYVEDGICYTACLTSGFKILNVSNPNSIGEIGSFVSGGYVYDLEIRDNIAFVGDGRLSIINITDLSNPVEISNYNPRHAVFDVQIQNDLAFIGMDERGIQAVNISLLDEPEKLGEYRTDDVIGLELSNNLLYLSMHEFGFKILSYSITEATNGVDLPGVIFAFTILSLLSMIVLFKKR